MARITPITTTCTVEGCDKPTRTGRNPYCEKHYYRLRRRGTLEARSWHRLTVCSLPDCDQPEFCDYLCQKHYVRVREHGDPHIVLPRPRMAADTNPNWKGDEAGYSAIHQRLRNERGSASEYSCVDCGNDARHWSYDHADPEGLISNDGLPYSVDPDHYQPRCVSCHKHMDLAIS